MTTIDGKFLNYKDESYDAGGSRVQNHLIQLANVGQDPKNSRHSEVQVKIPAEFVEKFKLNDSKVVDLLRGKSITVKGTMFSYPVSATGKSGAGYVKVITEFMSSDLAFVEKTQ